MPSYDFECLECNEKYSDLVKYDPTDIYEEVICPYCKSSKKFKLISSCNFKFSNPIGTDRWNSDSTGHDYRFKHNIPKVKNERAIAEQLSHMGSNPYGNSNDIEMDVGIHDAETRKGLS